MEGDTEKTKISYLHHWLNGEGISKIEGWKNSKTLISQKDYDKLTKKTGKCSQECKMQRMPQDWTLLQGMSVQEED